MELRIKEKAIPSRALTNPVEFELTDDEVRGVGRFCVDTLKRLYKAGKFNGDVPLSMAISYIQTYTVREGERSRVFETDVSSVEALANYILNNAQLEGMHPTLDSHATAVNVAYGIRASLAMGSAGEVDEALERLLSGGWDNE